MDGKIDEQENLRVLRLITQGDYAGLEKWIGDDPDKAKTVFSLYRSSKALEEMEMAIKPSLENRLEQAKEKVKSVVVAYLHHGLQLIAGEEHRLIQEPGYARSGDKDDSLISLNFGVFQIRIPEEVKIEKIDNLNKKSIKNYLLKINPCQQAKVYRMEDSGEKSIYQGQKIRGFSLTVSPGEYQVVIDGKTWDLKLK